MITYLMLILALSLDTFMASLSYEANKIKIPLSSNFVISLICTLMLIISLVFGNILNSIIPHYILKWISFFILFGIGAFKIFDSRIKHYIQKQDFKSKKVNFSFCNLKFILQIYSDYPKADQDNSKTLSIVEAISLSLALSIDGLSAGLAYHAALSDIFMVFILGLTINMLFIFLSKLISYFTRKTDFDFSLIGGFIFIVLAFLRI